MVLHTSLNAYCFFLLFFLLSDFHKSNTKPLINSIKIWPRVSVSICTGKHIAVPCTLPFGSISHVFGEPIAESLICVIRLIEVPNKMRSLSKGDWLGPEILLSKYLKD